MKGVVIGPVLAAFLIAYVTGSSTAGVIVFFVGLAVAVALILGNLGLVLRKRR